ncbi:hypothetical protein PIROE2DRAFT_14684 [Piromyces sp. E2]|nr:hypothetical protein PIROE2DRAFT_14684 [Piromyces sp. E2]|eukprot:OUM59713.1 hypothetical protein PIROE2DRAFT_14684 [Piromyces sp. E2]
MKFFILLIYFLLFQYSYTHTISIESNDIPDELINRFNTTTVNTGCTENRLYYCKDDVCACLDKDLTKPFIELPDKNGYIHRYILIPYVYDYEYIKAYYTKSNNNTNINLSTNCKTDTQCFSNKCIDNTCEYNAEANIKRCDTICKRPTVFTPSSPCYIYCGRMLGEDCTKDEDCSFKYCYKGRCSEDNYRPSEHDDIEYVLSAKDKGSYLELDNVPKKSFLLSNEDCTETYICKDRYEGWINDYIFDYYYRNELVNKHFGPFDRHDPNQCQFKGRVNIGNGKCYYTTNGGETTIDNLKGPFNVRYDFDGDGVNNRVLTEYGWCDFNYLDVDAKWMRNINGNLTLDQINMAGTHDSGTYAITSNTLPFEDLFKSEWGKTQNLDIWEQLVLGVRYLDIRLSTSEKKKYISLMMNLHIFDEAIDFVYKNQDETVIIHLKNDDVSLTTKDSKGNELFPTLESVRGKNINIPGMAACHEDHWNGKTVTNIPDNGVGIANSLLHELCYPRRNIQYGKNILVQDNYELPKKEKWEVIKSVLDHNIPTMYEETDEKENYKKYYFYIYGKKHTNTTMFYNNNDVLTINFMNIQAAWKFFRSVAGYANGINDDLFEYLNNKPYIHNQWMILDYPSPDLVRRIRDINNNGLSKRSELQNNTIQVGDYLIYTDLYYYIQTLPSVSDNDIPACLQRKTIINSQGQSQELIKTNNKCINNKMNKWLIRQNSKFYSIVSSYDAKCLNYSDEGLFIDYCKDNNKYEQFIIKNGKFCAQFDNSKCLGNNLKIIPSAFESPRYEYLTCSFIFADFDYKCCYNPDTKVEYVDEIGNWKLGYRKW